MREVLDAVLELAPQERELYLENACSNPEVRCQVKSLVMAYEQSGDFLEKPALIEEIDLLEPQVVLGKRIGAYRLIEMIGEGGMGAVYRAVRADDQFEKQVAIKLIAGSLPGSISFTRFKAERQILANLEHPNIARLLDGGTTDEGLPYFVMELVEGKPIDEYCDSRRLSIGERLRLFLTVCSAVQFAHQHLIVHRDLKPANILVMPDGTPKLLDFGIAKVLDTESFQQKIEATGRFFRLFTPEYASPEQVLGEPVTTASDVYSLGVVLYVLLSGHHPYVTQNASVEDITTAVCETHPLRPSTIVKKTGRHEGPVQSFSPSLQAISNARDIQQEKLSRQLAGDLDNIVLMALRKEPYRRYNSAEQLAEDLNRHLEGLPVVARKDTFGYRTEKFIKRNKAAVAAAALIVLSLVAGLITTLRQAHIARVQRVRAEQRFNDVRKLANSLIFEIHDSIEDLPGSTPARNLIVRQSLSYLDSLSRESAGDLSLQRELATAYEKIAKVQGYPGRANLGDAQGAIASSEKALAVRRNIAANNPSSVDDQLAVSADYRRTCTIQNSYAGVTATSLDNCYKALAINQDLHRRLPGNIKITSELAFTYRELGDIQAGNGPNGSLGDIQGGLESHTQAWELNAEIAKTAPADIARQDSLARLDLALGSDLLQLGRPAEAMRHYQNAIDILDAIVSRNEGVQYRRSLITAYADMGDTLYMLGHFSESLNYYKKAEVIYQALVASDPANLEAVTGLAGEQINIGNALWRADHAREGMTYLRQGLDTLNRVNQTHKNSKYRSLIGYAEISIARLLQHSGDENGARNSFLMVKELYAATVSENQKDSRARILLAGIQGQLGEIDLRRGNLNKAQSEYENAQALMEPAASAKTPR